MVPGMNFTTGANGGALNSNKGFNIRGTGTIGAGSSLAPLVLIDGMEGDLNTLNPQDIENISVLKDASASSIYGSRAAGGVVLVTTRGGKEGKFTVNYNNSFRFNSLINVPEAFAICTSACARLPCIRSIKPRFARASGALLFTLKACSK